LPWRPAASSHLSKYAAERSPLDKVAQDLDAEASTTEAVIRAALRLLT
jgi:hypothetical protein